MNSISYQIPKLVSQRIIVKTTSRPDSPWSAIFSVIVYFKFSNAELLVCKLLSDSMRAPNKRFTRDRICLDPFGIVPTLVRIHSVYARLVRYWNGTFLYGITFISGPIWYQIADPIRTGSTRSRVNTRLIRTNFVPVPDGSGPM